MNRLARMAAHLQPSPQPHRARWPAPDQQTARQRCDGALHLGASQSSTPSGLCTPGDVWDRPRPRLARCLHRGTQRGTRQAFFGLHQPRLAGPTALEKLSPWSRLRAMRIQACAYVACRPPDTIAMLRDTVHSSCCDMVHAGQPVSGREMVRTPRSAAGEQTAAGRVAIYSGLTSRARHGPGRCTCGRSACRPGATASSPAAAGCRTSSPPPRAWRPQPSGRWRSTAARA